MRPSLDFASAAAARARKLGAPAPSVTRLAAPNCLRNSRRVVMRFSSVAELARVRGTEVALHHLILWHLHDKLHQRTPSLFGVAGLSLQELTEFGGHIRFNISRQQQLNEIVHLVRRCQSR